MDIREASKKIAKYFLEKAIKYGTFKNGYPITYLELGEALGMSSNDCRLCCEYLESIGCIEMIAAPKEDETALEFKVKPSVVDFLGRNPA